MSDEAKKANGEGAPATSGSGSRSRRSSARSLGMWYACITGCPRCTGKHDNVKFQGLQRPTQAANCWAMCPSSKQPIFGVMPAPSGMY